MLLTREMRRRPLAARRSTLAVWEAHCVFRLVRSPPPNGCFLCAARWRQRQLYAGCANGGGGGDCGCVLHGPTATDSKGVCIGKHEWLGGKGGCRIFATPSAVSILQIRALRLHFLSQPDSMCVHRYTHIHNVAVRGCWVNRQTGEHRRARRPPHSTERTPEWLKGRAQFRRTTYNIMCCTEMITSIRHRQTHHTRTTKKQLHAPVRNQLFHPESHNGEQTHATTK